MAVRPATFAALVPIEAILPPLMTIEPRSMNQAVADDDACVVDDEVLRVERAPTANTREQPKRKSDGRTLHGFPPFRIVAVANGVDHNGGAQAVVRPGGSGRSRNQGPESRTAYTSPEGLSAGSPASHVRMLAELRQRGSSSLWVSPGDQL